LGAIWFPAGLFGKFTYLENCTIKMYFWFLFVSRDSNWGYPNLLSAGAQRGNAGRERQVAGSCEPAIAIAGVRRKRASLYQPICNPWHWELQTKQLLLCCCPLTAGVNGQRSPAQLPARRPLG
jgi:hypothetical protein